MRILVELTNREFLEMHDETINESIMLTTNFTQNIGIPKESIPAVIQALVEIAGNDQSKAALSLITSVMIYHDHTHMTPEQAAEVILKDYIIIKR
jgi:hypothetical protein